MTPEAKRAYNRAYNARKAAEKKAKQAATLAKRQANAAKARAAKAVKNGKPVLTQREDSPPEWSVAIKDLAFAVFIDGELVFSHDFNEGA